MPVLRQKRGTVVSVVRAAHHALSAARISETLLLAASAFCVTLAAAVHSSGRGVVRDDLVLAILTALLAGGAWLRTHRASRRVVASRVDKGLGLAGLVVTAWEIETERIPSSGIGRLCRQRASQRLSLKSAIRAVLPRSTPWIAAPFLAAALYAAALDAVSEPPRTAGIRTATAQLTRNLQDLRASAARGELEEGLSADQMQELSGLIDAASRLRQSALDEGADPAALHADLAALESRLAEFARRNAQGEDLARRLSTGQSLLDAARMQSIDATEAAPFDASPGNERTGVASSGPEGTMSGRPGGNAGAETPSTGPATEPTGPNTALATDSGLTQGRWWPGRYDGIVARWVESRRSK